MTCFNQKACRTYFYLFIHLSFSGSFYDAQIGLVFDYCLLSVVILYDLLVITLQVQCISICICYFGRLDLCVLCCRCKFISKESPPSFLCMLLFLLTLKDFLFENIRDGEEKSLVAGSNCLHEAWLSPQE